MTDRKPQMAVGVAETQQQALVIHQRLVDGDPTASADMANLILDAVVKKLTARWPGHPWIEARHDAAVTVLVDYLIDPTRYDPAKSSLVGWLAMQADGDLKNDYGSKPKRFEREWLVESDLPVNPRTGEPPIVGDQMASYDRFPDIDGSHVFATIRKAFSDERDRHLIWLMCVEGSRSTDEAARILGLSHLNPAERTAEVKRHKDRIMRHLRRLRLDGHHE